MVGEASINGSDHEASYIKDNAVGQYPFFQSDVGNNQSKFYAPARKATDAEWKLLARYEGVKKQQRVAQIDE
jgi:hypothetical protein